MNRPRRYDSDDEQRILEERARLLARVPASETDEDVIQVVVVALEQERYGIQIETVAEIQPFRSAAPLPGVPPFWIGLINLRSHLIPLLDLRAYLGLTPFPFQSPADERQGQPAKGSRPAGEPALEGQVVLVNGPGYILGLLVDQVIEVQKLPRKQLGPPLRRAKANERKITGGLTHDLMTVLDLEKLFSDPRLVVQD
ncbi:MAG: chemotaxis protein CheW [Chloroflexi bacterium]|jgi:purine-binding chemotaxis protein CheW|nr:chemotaxis protein CheW [Anaerolineaceae bacterium]NMB90885.1 chemotaxis protein CheW [Chloroflexota bacterium]